MILEECKKINEEYNYFTFLSDSIEETKGLPLSGLYLSVKDCICVEGMETTSSSRILKGYKPLFNATAIQRLVDAGATVIGKTVQDEFGFGSFCTKPGLDFKIPKNPHDKKRVTGGSSGGAAGITVKTEFPHVAIAESTGGSIACPASYCGIASLTPTYGVVSRYGLLDYGSSLDKIGVMAKKISDCEKVFKIMHGYDKKDSTSYKEKLEVKPIKKIAIVNEAFKNEAGRILLEELKKKGVLFDRVELPLNFEYAIDTYYVLAMAEASTNLSKFCGMRYGQQEETKEHFDKYFSRIRSKHFGTEAKRRIILGTFARMAGYRDAYYLKAAKVRTKLINEYKEVFEKYDVILTPGMPTIAPTFDEVNKLTPVQEYQMDILTAGPNLAGLPHMTIPFAEKDGMPIALMVIGPHFSDLSLLEFGKKLELTS